MFLVFLLLYYLLLSVVIIDLMRIFVVVDLLKEEM
ncbi:MAG: hypothetical protein JWO83_4980, partial [Caulobacteraceae bacterium]|nr:hypothetical protein [Caulobacteraceae bacterium]